MTVDLDAIARKHAELKEAKGGSSDFLDKFVQLNDGANLLRLLPPVEDGASFYAETSIHRVMDGGKNKNVHCRAVQTPTHDPEPCPLCNFVNELWDKHRALKLDKLPDGSWPKSKYGNLASRIKATPRYYINVLERDSGDVKIFSVGGQLFSKILDPFMDSDYGDITNTATGHDYKVVKEYSEDGKWPRYEKSNPRPKTSPLAESDKEIKEILAKSHDIHGLVKLPEFDEVKLLVAGLAAEHEIVTPSTAVVENGGGDNYLDQLSENENHDD